jgi:hypothetical protein
MSSIEAEVAQLVGTINCADPNDQADALGRLECLQKRAGQATRSIARLLLHDDPVIRYMAANALHETVRYSADAPAVVPQLAAALSDQSTLVRCAILGVFWKIRRACPSSELAFTFPPAARSALGVVQERDPNASARSMAKGLLKSLEPLGAGQPTP